MIKMYVTMKDVVHDEPYESWTGTRVDAVFSSEEKAVNRIKLLAEKESEKWEIENADEEEWPLEDKIDSPEEKEYRVWVDGYNYLRFYIVEVGFNPEGKEDSKPVCASYSDNPNDLNYAFWH